MRGLAETVDHDLLEEQHLENLDRLANHFGTMSADAVNHVLHGVHDALQSVFIEVIPARRYRDSPGLNRPLLDG